MIPGFEANTHRKRSCCYINMLRKFVLDKDRNVVYLFNTKLLSYDSAVHYREHGS
jgi:hypothetical protein